MPELNNQDGNQKTIEHPEVVKEVLEQVKSLGNSFEAAKKERESLGSDIEALKDVLDDKKFGDRVDPLVQEKVTKLTEAISTRQNELDLATHKRIDELDVAMQRRGGLIEKDEAQDRKDANVFDVLNLSSQGKSNHADLALARKDGPDVASYTGYRDAYRSYITQKTKEANATTLTPDQLRFMSVGQDPDGGYWVPITQMDRIIRRMFEVDPIRQLAGGITISSDRLKMMVDVDDLGTDDTSWDGETTAPNVKGTPQTGVKEIVVHTLVTQPKITQQLIEDAIINPEQWLADKIASRYERVEGAAFVTGDGVNKPRGFLTYDSTWVEGKTGIGNIEQVSMGHASKLTTDGFTKVMYSLLEGFLFRGTWLMNRLAVRDTMLLKDGDGQYLWRPGLQAGQPSVILAVPVRMSTTMPVVAANSLSVAIADWREAYLVVDRLGISTLRDPFTAKPFILFYTRKRVGGDVVNFQAIKIGKVAV